jgi:hypothetical protein
MTRTIEISPIIFKSVQQNPDQLSIDKIASIYNLTDIRNIEWARDCTMLPDTTTTIIATKKGLYDVFFTAVHKTTNMTNKFTASIEK